PAVSPGEIVIELPVGVCASAGHGCVGPESCKRTLIGISGGWAYYDLRQTEILRCSAHVQADGAGIECTVLRKEILMKTVVAETDLGEQTRAEQMRVRQRKNIYVGRRYGVEAGKNSASHQRQWKALVAVAEIVSSGQVVFFREAMVDLG